MNLVDVISNNETAYIFAAEYGTCQMCEDSGTAPVTFNENDDAIFHSQMIFRDISDIPLCKQCYVDVLIYDM